MNIHFTRSQENVRVAKIILRYKLIIALHIQSIQDYSQKVSFSNTLSDI